MVGQVVGEEMLVSGSDDFTLFLWKPGSEKTPVARMTGGWISGTEHHQCANVQMCNFAKIYLTMQFVKSNVLQTNIQMCILNHATMQDISSWSMM